MDKKDLLKMIDEPLLNKLLGFALKRTGDSYQAQYLCSDIVFELIKASASVGSINEPEHFIMRVARNVYADYSERRKRYSELFCREELENAVSALPYDEDSERNELLKNVFHKIAFLTKAYRSVMIMYYLDGLTVKEIAEKLSVSETAVRQRLFAARNIIKSEVNEMKENIERPLALDDVNFVIWGTGRPSWGDPRELGSRQLSKHVIWLCRKKAMTAAEISRELNVPTRYIEEELDILAKGINGEYGFLKKNPSGRYIINFILLDKNQMDAANAIYMEYIPYISSAVAEHFKSRAKDYLSFPYLNEKVDLNLIYWQQIFTASYIFSSTVKNILEEKYLPSPVYPSRPFSIFGYEDNGKYYGAGHDSAYAENVCGYKKIKLSNIYITRVSKHFDCGLNVSKDIKMQLALRAIRGLDISSLSEAEKEQASLAVECGYLFRSGNMLYTKPLVHSLKDSDKLFSVTYELQNGTFDSIAQAAAEKLTRFIKKTVPEHLMGEWGFANDLADLPVLDAIVEDLIEKNILIPPQDGIGAEGTWIGIEYNM